MAERYDSPHRTAVTAVSPFSNIHTGNWVRNGLPAAWNIRLGDKIECLDICGIGRKPSFQCLSGVED